MSRHYEEMLRYVGERTTMNVREEFLFERCPLLLHQCRSQHRRHLLTDVRKKLLPFFNTRLPLQEINKSVIMVQGSICALLFICAYNVMNNEELSSDLNEMLFNVNQIKENDPIKIELIQELVEQFSNFIFIEQYVGKTKELQISSLLLRIVDNIWDKATHFQTYRILAAILTEKDIKILASPDKIVTTFLKKINDITNNISQGNL